MPAKKRGKGKYAYQAKKSGTVAQPAAVGTQAPAARNMAPSAGVAAPPRPVSARPAAPRPASTASKTMAVQQHSVKKELRNIGIMAGIVLVVLIVLAIVLH